MTRDELRNAIVNALCEAVPEAEPGALVADVDLRDQLDIDSMDFLNFVVALHTSLGVEIPESDYRQLRTLDGCLAYLGARVGGGGG